MKPIRAIFGGSNRPQHLAMSRLIAFGIAASPLLLDVAPELALIASIAALAQEYWATADRDLHNKHPYWFLYAKAVPHRGWASHGLVIGTLVRSAIGFWFLLIPLFLASPTACMAWLAGALANDIGHLVLDYF